MGTECAFAFLFLRKDDITKLLSAGFNTGILVEVLIDYLAMEYSNYINIVI